MKKFLLIGIIGLSVFSFAQQKLESPKEYYFRNKMKADSLSLDYSETNEQLEKIEIITDFKDRLLLNNNYKDRRNRTLIIEEFRSYLPSKIDYEKICISEEKILDFYNHELVKQYTQAYSIIRKKIINYYDVQVRISETKVINILREANYPIEKFNKLSDEEKEKVIRKIDSGYVYP